MSQRGPLLRGEHLQAFNGLGITGTPVYIAATQLRSTIRRQLGEEAANFLSVPQINEAGNTLDWYAPFTGPVVPWSSATEEERASVTIALQQVRQRFHEHSKMLLEGAPKGDVEVFARMLPLVAHIPDVSHIYLVAGRPVITFWGFNGLNAPPQTDTVRDLRMAGPVAAAAPPLIPPPVGRPWWWWFLGGLLLVLLLLGLAFGIRSCSVAGPESGRPESGRKEEPGKKEELLPQGKPLAQGKPLDRVVTPPPPPLPVTPEKPHGAEGGVLLLPGLGGGTGGEHSPGAVVTPPGAPPKIEGGASSTRDAPPAVKVEKERTTPPPPPVVLDGTAGRATTPPVVPLLIPKDSEKNGSTDFLNGRWRSRTGLIESETGKPIEVEYDFKGGKGTITVHRSDGSSCTGPVEAMMNQGNLVIEGRGEAVCPNGEGFHASRVECRPGADGRAACQGRYQDGSGYQVQIHK